MLSRILLCFAIGSLALSGCSTPYKEKDETDRKVRAGEVIKDQSKDTSFQAFLGRLRIAVAKRDRVMLTTMMVPPNQFGYRWDPAPAGESPFDYWDQNQLWSELSQALDQPFAPHETYMVSAESPKGYRAGLRLYNGSWRLGYFVGPEEVQQGVSGEPLL